ncbi:MAG: nucleotidyltransferase family protein [Veillonellaceae bacterium]|nr:nucleotidyltransferase family protein [Veillonellaceae bacterium]
MQSIGIITEYNPFHSGHAYQLAWLKNKFPNHMLIIAMSGAFTQRGLPALMSKFVRAQMAISCGADIVLELPAAYALCSAQGFASGGLSLLSQVGCSYLAFGSELTNTNLFIKTAHISLSPLVQDDCRKLLQEGHAYGYALRQAIIKALPESAPLLSQPNALLGLEYVKAIISGHLPIQPLPIKRQGHYNQAQAPKDAAAPSGRFLRQVIQKELTSCPNSIGAALNQELPIYNTLTKLAPYIPPETLTLYKDVLQAGALTDYTRFDDQSLSAWRRANLASIISLPTVNEGLENTFLQAAAQPSMQDFYKMCKSKRYSYSRLQRISAYLLLNYPKNLYQEIQTAARAVPYARLLGASSRGRFWLKESPKLPIPLIQKWAPFYRQSQGLSKELAQLDTLASNLQSLCFWSPKARQGQKDFTQNPYIQKATQL